MVALPLGDALLRLGVALLLGLLVGIERERKNTHPAGMRTLALVSMGSALFTILSAYGFAAFTGPGYAPVDPTRIAAQIVSGIGFIGAGTILLQRNAVRGLTTAAAIWIDSNRDGQFEGGEPIVHSRHGRFNFAELAPGNYVVRVVPQNGYSLTSPSSGDVVVSVTQGAHVRGIRFSEKLIEG